MDHPIYVHFVRQLQHKYVCNYCCIINYYCLIRICVERIWPHINSRVNYPIKRILLWMEEHGHIDMTCEVTKFCVSFVYQLLVCTDLLLREILIIYHSILWYATRAG